MNKTKSNAKKRRFTFGRALGLLGAVIAILLVSLWWGERPIRKGEQAIEEGEFKYAIYVTTPVLKGAPGHTGALSIRARALVGLRQDPDEVIRIFDEIGAATASEMHALAQAYLMKLLWTKALPLLEQTVKVQPTNAEALYQVSKCRIELGRQKAALESAEQLAQIKGNEARAHYLIGWLHTNLGNNQKAAEAMAMVLQHEPNADNLPIHPAVFFLDYGHLLLRAGQPELALVPLKRSVKIQPSSSGFLGLGNAASQLGNNEQALQAWKAALKEAPSNAAARRALANDALQNAKPNEALDWLKPLAESPRLSAGTAYLFQRAYSGLKDEVGIKAWTEKTAVLRKKEEFRSSLDAMITDDPDGFWARVARTHDYASQGNWDQAESLLPSILQDAPGDPFIIELADAVRRRVELPAIEQIPISQN